MKTQIVTTLPPKSPIISLVTIEEQERNGALGERFFFATRHGQDAHILVHEEGGYIFRCVKNPKYGHSGCHKTITRAIERALDLNHWEVHRYDNLIDAAADGMFTNRCG